MKTLLKKIKVLVVEDDEDDFILFKSYLNDIKTNSFEIDWASGYKDALNKILLKSHDLYVFDFLLGAHTGLELIKKVIESGSDAPIIILTGKGDRRIDIEAMSLGASDYLIKGEIDTEKLERSIRYSIENAATIKALRESETKYRNIFERSRDMIYITNEEGEFIEFNDSATRIFGYSRDDFYNLNASDLYEEKEDWKYFMGAMHKTGIVSDYEVILRDKSGIKKYCVISGSLQRAVDDGKIYYQGIIHDITRRKKAEKDLIIAEKLAVTGRVVRILAHEIRNPLTNISLAVEQMEDEVVGSADESYLTIIKRNCRRINDLITELLISSKPAEVKTSSHSINQVLDETLALAMDRAALKNIQIVKEYSQNICNVTVDEPKIKIAFLNIIINAIEALPDKGGILRIKTEAVNDKCLITIEDNGPGISKENIPNLFEPYFTSKPNGVGLGLATTHNIIQSHNASIEVESETGKGAKFIIGLNMEVLK